MVNKRPNVMIILNDDMGYSDIECYGGEIETPNLNRLAQDGIRFTQFYNTARCCPSRASLLTGLHPHQTGIGLMLDDLRPNGYPGNLGQNCVTIAEVLKESGYRTYMSGKWHVASDKFNVNETWPIQRGFDRFYGIVNGAANYYQPQTLTRDNENIHQEAYEDKNYYFTDAVSDSASQFIREHKQTFEDDPFFLYLAYTAPHWPLHAKTEDIEKYKGRFNEGWDHLRQERLERMVDIGIIDPTWKLSSRDSKVSEWAEEDNKDWRLRCMEVYAAQIDRMDQGIGRLINALEETKELDNTLILFLSDNGGCAEEFNPSSGDSFVRNGAASAHAKNGEPVLFGNNPKVMPGPEMTYQSYGMAWANLSNTPFRLYKHWVHEGGIATPLIVHWPEQIRDRGTLRHTPAQLTDIMATILDATRAIYPKTYIGRSIPPYEGLSLIPIFESDQERESPLFWEHEGNAAVRMGDWKLVRKYPGDWELYNMATDRTEIHNMAVDSPDQVKAMLAQYEAWAERCGVISRMEILEIEKTKEL
jgi:arylsulfatase A-like enzyme